MTTINPARVLSIAGSDSGGGAGIQADLKTLTALGVYGATAVTAVTAQDTLGVKEVFELPAYLVTEQINAVVDDIGLDAAKTGMLANAEIVVAVSAAVRDHSISKLVVDPVMVSETGHPLLEETAVRAVIRELLPFALVVTPNIPEAKALTGRRIRSGQDIHDAAQAIHDMGATYVLIKGGHFDTPDATDYLFDGQEGLHYSAPRIDTDNTHGTGCTYSAAIAGYLAQGHTVRSAVEYAKRYLTEALKHGFQVGKGHGPLNHFWAIESHAHDDGEE